MLGMGWYWWPASLIFASWHPKSHLIAIRELQQRSKLINAQLPAVIVYQPSDLSDPRITGTELYSRLLTLLDHLQNLFLLERINIKYVHSNAQELIAISREMLVLTSGFWKERDRLLGLKGDFEWLVMYHAVPASGVLCLEPLKQQRNHSYALTLPRSDSIQDLIMFVTFLHWVKPGAPNYSLCQRISDIVGRVLEQVLETPKTSNDDTTTTAMTPPAPLDFNFDTNLRDFDDYAMFDLLDRYDWCNMSWQM